MTFDREQLITWNLVALRSDDDTTRKEAIEALGWQDLRDGRAVLPLITLLEDPDPDVRYLAASSLGDIGDARAVAPLLRALDDTVRAVRLSVVFALCSLKDQRATPPLIDMLDTSDDEDILVTLIEGLGYMGDVRAMPSLLVKLSDPNGGIRAVSASALGRISEVEVVRRLFDVLRDEDASVRFAAATALGTLGNAGGGEILRAYIEEGNIFERHAVLTAFTKIRNIDVMDALKRVQLHDPDEVFGERFADIATKALSTLQDDSPDGEPRCAN